MKKLIGLLLFITIVVGFSGCGEERITSWKDNIVGVNFLPNNRLGIIRLEGERTQIESGWMGNSLIEIINFQQQWITHYYSLTPFLSEDSVHLFNNDFDSTYQIYSNSNKLRGGGVSENLVFMPHSYYYSTNNNKLYRYELDNISVQYVSPSGGKALLSQSFIDRSIDKYAIPCSDSDIKLIYSDSTGYFGIRTTSGKRTLVSLGQSCENTQELRILDATERNILRVFSGEIMTITYSGVVSLRDWLSFKTGQYHANDVVFSLPDGESKIEDINSTTGDYVFRWGGGDSIGVVIGNYVSNVQDTVKWQRRR